MMRLGGLAGLLAVVGALGGCATTTYHLMATPVVYKDPRLDIVSQIPESERSTRLTDFFATRRAPVPQGGAGHYGNDEAEAMRLGVARVQLGEPGWTYQQLSAAAVTSTAKKPLLGQVETVEELGTVGAGPARTDAEREFVVRIDAHIARTNNPEVVMYVHGYRATFDEVVVMMGSLSAYLQNGAVVAFAWPTGQRFWDYLTDCPRAEGYAPDVARMIALLAETKARYVNLLAYSCGSPVLANALAQLRARHPEQDRAKRYRIGNVIFVASDIDLKTFAREHVPAIMALAQQASVDTQNRP